MTDRTHEVVTLAFSGSAPFEFSVAAEVFALERPELDVDWWYTFELCSSDGQPMDVIGGLRVSVPRGPEALADADTIVIAGSGTSATAPPAVREALLAAYERGSRIVTICSGAFVLASTGLLDGREATTHWMYAAEFRVRFPAVVLRSDALYVQDGPFLTSAGTAAGVDALLHVVRQDHGAHVANQVARRMVVPPHREGGQQQFVPAPVVPQTQDPISRTMHWALDRLEQPLTVGDLAQHAHLSERQLARRFRQSTGTTPAAWLGAARVRASLPLLEESDLPVERIGERVGIGSSATYRRRFAAEVGVPPSRYRAMFRRERQGAR